MAMIRYLCNSRLHPNVLDASPVPVLRAVGGVLSGEVPI